MRKLKKTISFILVIVTMFTCITPLNVFAASNNKDTNYSKYDQPETKGDYAYYNGKVKKSSSTSTAEIKWMQAALNYCIKNEGLNTSYINVDGSFGPASQKATKAFQKAVGLTQDGSFGPDTIKKMINVLNDGRKTFASNTSTSKNANISSKCNIVKTYKIGNTKYYMANLKTDYKGVKKGSIVFLDSKYTAVTDSNILKNLLFTNAVDILSKETNGFADLTKNYALVLDLNNVCQKILEAQLTQKIVGSASGSFLSIMLSSNPKSVISASKYLTKEGYITAMTMIYFDGITNTALSKISLIKNRCKDGISSLEEAEEVKDALIGARTVFLIAGTDCMLGLVQGYTNKKSATLNSLKTYLNAMGDTLLDTYGGKLAKVIDKYTKGQSVLSELNNIYGYASSYATAKNTFNNMFNGYVNKSINAVATTQNKLK